MTQDNKTVTIQARHNFTDADFKEISQKIARSAADLSRLESEFSSLKKDFGARIQHQELERDTQISKVRDGFEMRPTEATVRLDWPEKGRKTYFHLNTDRTSNEPGEIIHTDAMDFADAQRELPLESATTGEVITDLSSIKWKQSRCDYTSSTYGCCQLEAGHKGAHAFDGHALGEIEWWECSNGHRNKLASDICVDCEEPLAKPLNPERFPETGDSAEEVREAREVIEHAAKPIGTSLADKLTEAASGKELPRVVVDFGDKDGWNKCLARWRKAARAQGWPELCADIIKSAAVIIGNDGNPNPRVRVLDVLNAHSQTAEDFKAKGLHEQLAETFGVANEGGEE